MQSDVSLWGGIADIIPAAPKHSGKGILEVGFPLSSEATEVVPANTFPLEVPKSARIRWEALRGWCRSCE